MVFALGDLKWTTNEAIWFPGVGETLKIVGIHIQTSKLYRMAITRGRGLASAVVRFNLHDAEGNTLSRLETSGGHLNPIGPPFPDPLLEDFSGRRFIDEAHLHLVFDECSDSWAIPLSITDFFTCDPVKVMMSAYSLYCGFDEAPMVSMELFDDHELRLHQQKCFKPNIKFVHNYH